MVKCLPVPIRYFIFFFLLQSPTVLFSQSSRADVLVPVTARYEGQKKVKHHNYRLQILPHNDSIEIFAFNVRKLTKSLKSLRFPNVNKIKRATLEKTASNSLDRVYQSLTVREHDLSYKIPTSAEYKRQKAVLLAGKNASPYFHHQWIKLAVFPKSGADVTSFQTRGVFKPHHEYALDFLPGAVAGDIPAVDPWNCQPAEFEFLKLRRLQGYGMDKIKYQPYEMSSRINIRQSFEVYFKQNETSPDPNGLREVIRYLEQNDLAILQAVLEGGCSIEGSLDRNAYLQAQRANVLQKALHQYADALIQDDTVLLTDVTQQFREIIKSNANLKWLDSLDDESMRQRINNDAQLRESLEPVFVQQRKASLRLVMAKRLTRQEQFDKLVTDLNKASSIWNNRNLPTSEGERIVMGMLDKLFTDYEKGNITKNEIDRIISETSYPDNILVLIGYHYLKKYEDKTWPQRMRWSAYWKEYDIARWLERAHESLLNLLRQRPVKEMNARYMRMLNDFQTFQFYFVEEGLISIASLCDMPYPDDSDYMGLKLSQYAFLYEMRTRSDSSIHCIPQRAPQFKADSITVDAFLDGLAEEVEKQTVSPISKPIVKRSFNTEPKSPYYYLLKQHFLKNNKTALEHVTNTHGGSVEFNEFNLWHLLENNVTDWRPAENHFYDEEVGLYELDRLIAMMQRVDKHLCKPQVNQLYLTYHLKMLYYLERYAEPGNPRHAKLAETSLKFITNYYKARGRHVTSRLSLHIVKQLNLFNWLPGSESGAYYGYDLLNSIARVRVLNEEESKIYAHYVRLFNPSLRRMPHLIGDKEKFMVLSTESF